MMRFRGRTANCLLGIGFVDRVSSGPILSMKEVVPSIQQTLVH